MKTAEQVLREIYTQARQINVHSGLALQRFHKFITESCEQCANCGNDANWHRLYIIDHEFVSLMAP